MLFQSIVCDAISGWLESMKVAVKCILRDKDTYAATVKHDTLAKDAIDTLNQHLKTLALWL